MARTLALGIVGCGNISTTYFALSPLFRGIEIKACADLVPAVAEARAQEYGVRAESVARLLDAADVDIIVNLTIPAAHHAVSQRALDAGTSIRRSRSSSPSKTASTCSRAPPGTGCASARRPTPSWAAPISSCAISSIQASSERSPAAPAS
jgi:hypothetical protein